MRCASDSTGPSLSHLTITNSIVWKPHSLSCKYHELYHLNIRRCWLNLTKSISSHYKERDSEIITNSVVRISTNSIIWISRLTDGHEVYVHIRTLSTQTIWVSRKSQTHELSEYHELYLNITNAAMGFWFHFLQLIASTGYEGFQVHLNTKRERERHIYICTYKHIYLRERKRYVYIMYLYIMICRSRSVDHVL